MNLQDRPAVKKYLAHEASSDMDKLIAKKAWAEYYAKVRETKAFRRFVIIGQLYKQKNFGKMKLYTQKAKEQIANQDWELTEPTYYDVYNPGWDVFLYKQSLLRSAK